MSPEGEPHLVAAKRIYRAIRNQAVGWPPEMFHGLRPDWLGRAVSSLILALGDEPVTFVSLGSAEDQSAGVALKGVVVGQTIVAELSVDSNWKDDNAGFTVAARSLTGLVQLEVATDMHPQDTSGWRTWPGNVQLELHFQYGSPITLPVDGRLDPDDNQDYLELVRRLPTFLSR